MPSALRPTSRSERAALIHREVIQLIALVFIAVVAFFVTRAVAMNNRDLKMRTAAEWYRRGEQLLAAGRLDEAIDAFRRATVRNRSNRTYLLALSRALVHKGDYDSARSILLWFANQRRRMLRSISISRASRRHARTSRRRCASFATRCTHRGRPPGRESSRRSGRS